MPISNEDEDQYCPNYSLLDNFSVNASLTENCPLYDTINHVQQEEILIQQIGDPISNELLQVYGLLMIQSKFLFVSNLPHFYRKVNRL